MTITVDFPHVTNSARQTSANLTLANGVSENEPAIERMGQVAELTGLPLACVDVATRVTLAHAGRRLPLIFDDRLASDTLTKPYLWSAGTNVVGYAIPLPSVDDRTVVGIGWALTLQTEPPPEVVLAAAQENWSQDQLSTLLTEQVVGPEATIGRVLELALANVEHQEKEHAYLDTVDDLSQQIQSTYEEISLLHALTTKLQISHSPRHIAELCLERIDVLIPADGSLIWMEERSGESHMLQRGQMPIDEFGLARLIASYEPIDWSRPLVRNHVERSVLGQDFPGLHNFVLVAIAEGSHRSGWIMLCNLPDQEFGTVEASLINSVATILGTHVRNIDLYREHENLLLSFVRSLVSTLDAKDPYTRGHSERVALIAQRLAKELGLAEDDLESVYLSGLLHDIGKIGVDDRILRKPGRLTDEEMEEIKKHPMNGYQILAGLHNLQHVLPGVRSHHEAFDGSGYPDGLRGVEIPLMARILAVADSYDAMGSDRPYRPGMPLERLENILRNGAGQQWDSNVVDAYFSSRDDIFRICRDYKASDNCAVRLLRGMKRRGRA